MNRQNDALSYINNKCCSTDGKCIHHAFSKSAQHTFHPIFSWNGNNLTAQAQSKHAFYDLTWVVSVLQYDMLVNKLILVYMIKNCSVFNSFNNWIRFRSVLTFS